MPSRRKPRAVTPVAPPTPAPAPPSLREQLDRIQKSTQEIQETIDAERKVFENKTAHDRKLLEVRQEEAKELQAQIDMARNDTLLAFLKVDGAIDVLAPEHSRTSCSDENRSNGTRGCSRCVLLDAKDLGYIDFTWEFQATPS